MFSWHKPDTFSYFLTESWNHREHQLTNTGLLYNSSSRPPTVWKSGVDSQQVFISQLDDIPWHLHLVLFWSMTAYTRKTKYIIKCMLYVRLQHMGGQDNACCKSSIHNSTYSFVDNKLKSLTFLPILLLCACIIDWIFSLFWLCRNLRENLAPNAKSWLQPFHSKSGIKGSRSQPQALIFPREQALAIWCKTPAAATACVNELSL